MTWLRPSSPTPVMAEIAIRTRIRIIVFRSGVVNESRMASDIVRVLPLISPPTIRVAPYSPRARAAPIVSPAAIPRRASGSVTSSATRQLGRPIARAACSTEGSTPSMAARAARMQNGYAATVATMMHPMTL